jgi:acyl-homoserine lactone synthase
MEAAMIHVVTVANRHLYRAQLAEMHQLRRVHFIEERGWNDLTVVDGGEYDDFDDDLAVYLLALGPAAEVLGSLRARPTTDKCMLKDAFPELIGFDQPPVSGPDVWELTRSFSTHAARAMVKKSGVRITPDVLLSAMEWANDAGIERLVAVIDLAAFAFTRSRGWNIRMTGLPLDTREGPIIGVEFANTTADIEAGRRLAGRSGRASYFVTPEDVAAFGSLANIEAEFALVRADGQLMPGESVTPRNQQRLV